MRILVPLLVVVFATTGCASIFNGGYQDVHVQTVPANAKLSVSTQAGNTHSAPATLRLKRRKDHRITARKEGYKSASAYVTDSVDGPMVALDCVLWWCIPLLWEWPLGHIKELHPDTVTIVLEEEEEEPRRGARAR